MTISFIPMTKKYIPLWQQWIEKDHVKKVWLIDGYETADYIYEKIRGNGYDYPLISLFFQITSLLDILQLVIYMLTELFLQIIREENYLDKGFGTQIVRSFIEYIFQHFPCQTILIDPVNSNKRAIRCYEKAGFKFVKEAFDGVTNCYIMKIRTNK